MHNIFTPPSSNTTKKRTKKSLHYIDPDDVLELSYFNSDSDSDHGRDDNKSYESYGSSIHNFVAAMEDYQYKSLEYGHNLPYCPCTKTVIYGPNTIPKWG